MSEMHAALDSSNAARTLEVEKRVIVKRRNEI